MLNRTHIATTMLVMIMALIAGPAMAERADVGTSPWGPDDELGRLNLMSDASRAAILARIDGVAGGESS